MYFFINLSAIGTSLGGGWLGELWGGSLLLNSSKTAWNFQMPFYKMDTDSLRMIYLNFHNPICLGTSQ